LIARGLSRSLQRELDTFSKEVLGGEFNIREVTKGAFSQARAKLNPEAFKELNKDAVTLFYQDAPYQVWHGHRLLAVDGTRLMLPRHDSVIEAFGEHGFGPNAASKRSMAVASFLYDPVRVWLPWTLKSHHTHRVNGSYCTSTCNMSKRETSSF